MTDAMSGAFAGIKVLEVAEWTFVPSAGAVLAQHGADVVKIERPVGGDAQRGLAVAGVSPVLDGVSLQMQQTNFGGKRSIGIDIRSPEGQELVCSLVADADVFLTSLLPATRERYGLDEESMRAVNSSIVYAVGHGLGSRGPDAGKGGYDMTAYWCRGGFSYALTEEDFPGPVKMRPATGDKMGAMNLVAGVSAALFRRERTGQGASIEVSLLATAVWQTSSDLVYSTALGAENSRVSRGRNPLTDYYETADGRWLVFALIEADRWWKRFAVAIDRPDLLEDERFLTAADRSEHYDACVAELRETFRKRSYYEWRKQLADFGGAWSPVQSQLEVAEDPQVIANEYIQHIDAGNGRGTPIVPAPFQFMGERTRLEPCPEPGAHTEEILLEAGSGWERIIALKDAGVIT